MSKIYSLKRIQKIPAGINDVWPFFSSAENLNIITPKNMGFKIISKTGEDKIYAGQLIEYTVSPLFNIPLYWMTEITHVQEKVYFADEQRFGPYSFWHHQHHFKTIENGIEMTDIVHYKIPFWFIGDIANALIVQRKLKQIFDFRYKAIGQRFGEWN